MQKNSFVQFLIPTVAAFLISRAFGFGMIPTIITFAVLYGISAVVFRALSADKTPGNEI